VPEKLGLRIPVADFQTKSGASRPRVSIIMPVYNGERYIADAVNSVLAQTYVNLEIIVVDDGSTDQTLSQIESISDTRLRILRQSNQGVSAAANAGIKASHGEYLAGMGSDDIWQPNKIEKQVALLDASPEVDLVYCWTGYIGPQSESLPYVQQVEMTEAPLKALFTRHMDIASSLLYRRSCFEIHGLFDSRLRHHEDWDLLCRLAMARVQFAVIREPLCRNRLVDSGLTYRGLKPRDIRVLGENLRTYLKNSKNNEEFVEASRACLHAAIWMTQSNHSYAAVIAWLLAFHSVKIHTPTIATREFAEFFRRDLKCVWRNLLKLLGKTRPKEVLFKEFVEMYLTNPFSFNTRLPA
jgi:glycosyltransferase involved in cell wall biosynthesis